MELGERLKNLREEKGFTIESLASQIEITPEEIKAWEENTSTPDARGLMKLSKTYGMSIDSIVYEADYVPEYDESKAVYATGQGVLESSEEKNKDSTASEVENSSGKSKNSSKSKKQKKVKKQKKKMTASEWMTVFVFPLFCILVYFCMGIILKVWHPTWLILAVIPPYFLLYFLLRGIGNKVDSAVEEFVKESENERNENNH